MAATLKIQDSINFAQPFLMFYPLSIGTTMQPAVHMANAVAQVILAPPFKWRWNRNSINWVTTSGTQTYMSVSTRTNGGAVAQGTTIIDSNGNGQYATVGGTAGGSTPTWATGIFVTTSDNTVTWQNIGPLASISQVTDFGYIENAHVQDINAGASGSAPAWKQITPRLDLSRDTSASCPKFISAQLDDNLGDVAFRLMPVPGSAYPISVQYQKQPSLFTAVNNTWSPIPDFMFYTYSFGFLALALFYKSDSRYQWASQQFITRLLGHAEGLTESEINIFLKNWAAITTGLDVRTLQANQGNQARMIG